MSRKNGLFVVGTDTGVGKSLVACSLVRLARIRGVDAVGVKPVETGCIERNGELFPEDGARLHAASEHVLTLQETAPFRFSLPASPARAAAAEGRTIRLSDLEAHVQAVSKRVDFIVVEAAGGLMVPIAGSLMVLDLVERLGYPALLTARTRLGTINHTLLSVHALLHRGINIAGIILSPTSPEMGPEEKHTPGDLAELVGTIPVVLLPYLDDATRSDPAASAKTFADRIDDRIQRTWLGL